MASLVPWKRKNRMLAKQEEKDPFAALQQRMNEVFEQFTHGFEMAPLGAEAWAPRVNISESDNELRVTVELPGVEEKDIDVTLTKDLLTIKGEKNEEKEEKGRNFFRVERSYGSFHRDIPLPCEVEGEKVEAKFKNGVLNIALPKSKQAQKEVKKITLNK